MVVGLYKMVGEEIRQPLGINNTSGEDDFLPLPPNKWPDPPILLNILHVLKDGSYGPLSQVNLLRQKRSDLCNFSTVWRNDLASERPAYPNLEIKLLRSPFIGAMSHSKSNQWKMGICCECLPKRCYQGTSSIRSISPSSLWRPISFEKQRSAARQAYQLGEAISHTTIC